MQSDVVVRARDWLVAADPGSLRPRMTATRWPLWRWLWRYSPRRLLLLPAVAAVTPGALLAPHLFSGDVWVVVIMMAAVYAPRFGPRGMALGMTAAAW